jgi:hypothetical protein
MLLKIDFLRGFTICGKTPAKYRFNPGKNEAKRAFRSGPLWRAQVAETQNSLRVSAQTTQKRAICERVLEQEPRLALPGLMLLPHVYSLQSRRTFNCVKRNSPSNVQIITPARRTISKGMPSNPGHANSHHPYPPLYLFSIRP